MNFHYILTRELHNNGNVDILSDSRHNKSDDWCAFYRKSDA